jgi:Mlc titration factor MtfA (ptsG expression regulator)/Tfp pilus assembly protein PilF
MPTSFTESWRPFVEANIFLFRLLPQEDQARLLERMEVFIESRFWEGCAGLEVTDEMRVTVAAQACLLVLGMHDYHFDELKTVLLYPSGFLARDEDEFGQERDRGHLLGQAAHEGPVLLSWWHARWEGRRSSERNLVLHEFAHKLAELGDPERGLPPFRTPELAHRWEDIVYEEFERLVEDVDYGRPTLLDPYGASNRPEFFAVATECFFLRSRELQERHPELYAFLSDCYQQDPAAWPWEAHPVGLTPQDEEEYARHEIEECSVAIHRHPDRIDSYLTRAGLYRDVGDYDNALADYTRALEQARPDDRAALHHQRGVTYLWAKRPAEAIVEFDEAIRLAPGFVSALCSRAAAHRALGEHRRALSDLNRALSLDPHDDGALVERARVHLALGKKDHALRDATRAMHLSPYNTDAYLVRAEVYESKGHHDKARADREEAARREGV